MIERAVEHLGEDRAARYLRKFYPWYVERLGGGRALQAALQTAPSLAVARSLLHEDTGAGRRGVVVGCRTVFRRIGRVPVILVALLAFAPAAAAQVQPYATNDYGGFRNVLPPGQNGLDDAAQAAAFKAAGAYPTHANDQLGMYSSLATSVPITEAADPAVLQGRHVRRAVRRRGGHREPRAGRDDRARLAVRRARTSTATRARR